ncbi:MAG: hypothetical protein HY649_09590 [Acidobacteria bacterium]|nr:hypothetical protein [Acidobacteriota bacterium]
MAEVGLLPFARVALQVATAVLLPYRSRGDRKGAGLTAVKSDENWFQKYLKVINRHAT